MKASKTHDKKGNKHNIVCALAYIYLHFEIILMPFFMYSFVHSLGTSTRLFIVAD